MQFQFNYKYMNRLKEISYPIAGGIVSLRLSPTRIPAHSKRVKIKMLKH